LVDIRLYWYVPEIKKMTLHVATGPCSSKIMWLPTVVLHVELQYSSWCWRLIFVIALFFLMEVTNPFLSVAVILRIVSTCTKVF
jgi:hypothetical protein